MHLAHHRCVFTCQTFRLATACKYIRENGILLSLALLTFIHIHKGFAHITTMIHHKSHSFHLSSLLIFTGEYEKQSSAHFTSMCSCFSSCQIFFHATYCINCTAFAYEDASFARALENKNLRVGLPFFPLFGEAGEKKLLCI